MLLQVASQARGADGVELASIVEDALGQGHIAVVIVRRNRGMKGLDFLGKAPAIMDQLPAPGKSLNTAERLEIHDIRVQQFVRRFSAEGEIELGRIADDPRAWETLEPVDLDLRRVTGFNNGIESLGKGFLVFTWQTENQIRMDNRAGLLTELAEIFKGVICFYAAADKLGNFGIDGLESDFKMERAFRKGRHAFKDIRMQMVRVDFKMQAGARRDAGKKEVQYRAGVFDGRVETAV